jgi:hypothetical protein
MEIEDRPKVGTGPDWLRCREGCAWDRSSRQAVFHWGFCRKPGVKIPLLAKMAVYISHKTRAKHTLPFLRARTPFPSATANPAQFQRAFTLPLWRKVQSYGGGKQPTNTYG